MPALELPSISTGKSAHAGITVIAVAAVIALLYYGRVFCITMVVAAIIAVLLEPLVGLGMRLRLPRSVASLLACLIALVVVYLIGLGAYTQVQGLREDLPAYSQRMNDVVDSAAAQVDALQKRVVETFVPKRLRESETPAAQVQPPTAHRRRKPDPVVPAPIQEVRIRTEPKSILVYLYGYLRSIYDVLLMSSFVPFLVYFTLSWRDHLRRSFLGLLDGGDRHVAGRTWNGMTAIARAYVLGNFILGILLSVISCIFFFAIGLPYWLVAGILSGFLSLVPYAGLPFAMAPPLIDALAVYTNVSMYLLIAAVVGALHLIALNLLYPRIVGARLHLNPLAVTVALMFWGMLWGGVGLVLAIPITAAIKAVCDNLPNLTGYGRLLGDSRP